MCQQTLIHLGYSLIEIKHLHECKFDIQKYMDSQTTDPTRKVSAVRSTALPSTNSEKGLSISSDNPLSHSATSLLSYVPPSPLDSVHIDNADKRLTPSVSDSVVREAQKLGTGVQSSLASASSSTQQPPKQAKTTSIPQSVSVESVNKQANLKLDDCGGIFDFELDD